MIKESDLKLVEDRKVGRHSKPKESTKKKTNKQGRATIPGQTLRLCSKSHVTERASSMKTFTLVCACIVVLLAGLSTHAKPPSYTTQEGVSVAWFDGTFLLMDVDTPQNQGEAPAKGWPAIISLHGGGWRTGGRDGAGGYKERLRGYVMFRPEYRLSGTWKFPAQINDVKTVVRFVRKNATKYNINPNKIGVWGVSAGAHLAALLATSGPGQLEGDRGDLTISSAVQAVVTVAAPTDFSQLQGHDSETCAPDDFESPGSIFSMLFTNGESYTLYPDRVREANPIAYINGNEPPFFITHGGNDCTVPFNQSELLVEALQAANVEVEFFPVPNAGHNFNIYQYLSLKTSVQAFLDRHLK